MSEKYSILQFTYRRSYQTFHADKHATGKRMCGHKCAWSYYQTKLTEMS